MYTLQFKDNKMFLDNEGNPVGNEFAIRIQDRLTAYKLREHYYLIAGASAKPVQVVRNTYGK